MGMFLALVIVVAVCLLINKMGDWFDSKTGWAVGAIIAAAVGAYLIKGVVQIGTDSAKPTVPICKQVGGPCP